MDVTVTVDVGVTGIGHSVTLVGGGKPYTTALLLVLDQELGEGGPSINALIECQMQKPQLQ